ncbi:hypothetical protein [Staphylococcus pseudoxylosus]|uniref:hypothetical protein n=1 Tax=Staphylococcus pseudoxylosus TaxID=2282419 RepID=UPI003F554657
MIIAILSIIIGGFALLIADPEKNLIVSIIGMLFLLSGVVSMYIEENKKSPAPQSSVVGYFSAETFTKVINILLNRTLMRYIID